MSMCMAFPRAGAGFSAKRQRYEELIDATKVVKEQLEKESREKRKEWRHNKWNNIDEISKIKKADYKKKSEENICTSGNWKKMRHFELEPKYDHDYYYYYYRSSSYSSERRRRRRRRDEDESKAFERRRCSLMSSWENKKKKVPAALPVATTSAYDIDSTSKNNNDNNTNTNKEELSSTSSETSSSSCEINICGIINDEEEEITRNKRSLEKEELEYKKLELEIEKMVPLNDAASLPPLDLDWLYPKTTPNKDEEDERRRPQKKISLSSSDADADQINRYLGPPRAQYLHEVNIFALPYVLPF